MSEWTDDEGEPLGTWHGITEREFWAEVGGFDGLTVFATLTDPEGTYGARQIYTAWGRPNEPAPLVDIRDYLDYDGKLAHRVCQRFVLREGVE